MWTKLYESIYISNDFLIHVEGSTVIPQKELDIYQGEALFFRALDYFYLVNLFGDVPLLTTSDVSVTSAAGRTPKAEVYQQIITDLQNAQRMLQGSTNGNTRITVDAATALLARVYLYLEQWDKAIAEANRILPVVVEMVYRIRVVPENPEVLRFRTERGKPSDRFIGI